MNNPDHSSATLKNLRERFEAEYKDVLNFELGAAGGYNEFMTFVAFRAYQSAHISAVKQCAEICNEVESNITSHLYADHASAYHVNNIKHSILALLQKENSDE